MRAAFVVCLLTSGCAGAVLPVAVPVAEPVVRHVAPAPAPASAPLDERGEVLAALVAAAAVGAPEVTVEVRGRRYACLRRPVVELARGALDAETVWTVYVRDLSEAPAGQVIDMGGGR